MSSLLVIRIVPQSPLAASDFTNYLSAPAPLQITAFDLTFGSVSSSPPGANVGTASYVAPTNPPFPMAPVPIPPGPPPVLVPPTYPAGITNGIVQQYYLVPAVPGWIAESAYYQLQSVATAVIEIASPGAFENIRLVVQWGSGTGGVNVPISMDYYDVALAAGPLPDFSTWYTLPPSLYLSLPTPPPSASGGVLVLPADGSPPAFDSLLGAVSATLSADPGGPPDIGGLDIEQCRNIAYEIVWNQQSSLPSLPNSSGDVNELGDMYTNPPNNGVLLAGTAPNLRESDRQQFEGELKSYYAQADATADRLTNFVYALATAVNCEERSLVAREALLELPVNPGQTGSGPQAGTEVVLTGFGAVNPPTNFGVPAAYFYALTTMMPPQIDAPLRYQIATSENLQRMLADLTGAYTAGTITDSEHFVTLPPATPPVNAAQAARRLSALNVPAGSATPLAPLGALVLLTKAGTPTGNMLPFGSTTGVTPGMHVSGTNIATDTTVSAVTSDSVALSAPITAAVSVGSGITFSPAYNADLLALVQAWLAFPAPAGFPSSAHFQPGDDGAQFWPNASQAHPTAFLGIILSALTGGYIIPSGISLGTQIEASLSLTDIQDLAKLTAQQWTNFFVPEPVTWLPPFTAPGNQQARIAAFIRFVQRFFTVLSAPASPPPAPAPNGPRLLEAPSRDWLADGLAAYEAIVGGGPVNFWTGGPLDQSALHTAAAIVFHDDSEAQAWLVQALNTIQQLAALAHPVAPPGGVTDPDAWHFSLMEALYARGFAGPEDIVQLDADSFQQALTGTIAYDYASQIYVLAPASPPGPHSFVPVNPGGSLTNCIPPPCLSPLGPIEYLHQLLHLTPASTCEDPCPTPLPDPNNALGTETLGGAIGSRRGPIGTLVASCANLETPLPLIDIVNENLEAVASEVVSSSPVRGMVYNTAAGSLAGHALCDEIECEDAEESTSRHDPATLFATIPEYSSPAAPVAQPNGYEALKNDFSAPSLPYSQPLDVSRSYLEQLGSDRFETMRAFRRYITEFVLDPSLAPPTFQAHLWRYPARLEVAIEFLDLSPEEFQSLFDNPPVTSPWTLYGFASETVNGTEWIAIVLHVDQFLKRTGIGYCEFLELWQAAIVPFSNASTSNGTFPTCQPCCLDELTIAFNPGQDPAPALLTLAIVIRLWRKLRYACEGGYSFAQLGDVLSVLESPTVDLNGELVRQLAALCMLREHFHLPLVDRADPQTGSGADRTHLLALWVGPSARKWPWAVAQLLQNVQRRTHQHFPHRNRPPEFIKLLADNLNPLSRLAGFDPAEPASTWHARPTCTLRFAEILTKIYASDFNVGELLFLFTAEEHLDGNDPFPLQEPDDALDLPLSLPESEHEYSLAALRHQLLHAEVSHEDAEHWTWSRIAASLRDEFGYVPPSGTQDPLLSLGQHFFPDILEASGQAVRVQERQYRIPFSSTTPLMWNAPLDGPFRYDSGGGGALWAQVPLRDEAVIAKLSHIRQLLPIEAQAVQNLYFLPRRDLAPFAFLFPGFLTADRHLIQEVNEHERWRYFQRHFALAHRRCHIIAEHLSHHVARVTGRRHADDGRVAWKVLQNLFADENRALTPWESDSGEVPAVAWTPPPGGGAFAALLGLLGTGLLGEFDAPASTAVWREVRGPLSAFGHDLNEANSPVPAVLPSSGLTLSTEQLHFIALQNGYALRDRDSAFLGGAEGFNVTWTGVLLVDAEGEYRFLAGAPTPDGERPSFEGAEGRRWRVTLARGQKTWVVLDHQRPEEQEHELSSLRLKRGAYRLTIDFTQPAPDFTKEAAIHSQHTGFQLKYVGPDSADRWVAIPLSHLFQDARGGALDQGVSFPQPDQDVTGAPGTNIAQSFLHELYTSSLRDIRRTYQRAFKALLFAERFGLSAAPITDDRQSEFGYMLANPSLFAGVSYYYDTAALSYQKHAANFDFNFLPLLDDYLPPRPAEDDRVQPSLQREQALFDWWERTFDYVRIREDTESARARPAWLLFHEAKEKQPSTLTPLLRHLGIDFRHAGLVLNYFESVAANVYSLSYTDLEDDRWVIRVWHGQEWIRCMLQHFACQNVADAQPGLWVSDDPGVPVGAAVAGNANLTAFVGNGSFENGPPRRYQDVQRLNDGLRGRARDALVTYLCSMDRVPLPWSAGTFAQNPRDLSDLLLLDVEAGTCERASRIDEAISAVHTFVRRARLGLEPSWPVTRDFSLLWDKCFATFRLWQRCERRHLYQENWIEWEELENARRREAFRFLESELRRTTLTSPMPGGLEWWPEDELPIHSGLLALQRRDPSELARLQPEREGLDLLGRQERGARPSWLAPLSPVDRTGEDGPDTPPADGLDSPPTVGSGKPRIVSPTEGQSIATVLAPQAPIGQLPFWMAAAIRLGKHFYRIAAAGDAQARMPVAPHKRESGDCCCAECGHVHPEVMDEYYFWLVGAEQFDPPGQSGATPADADYEFEYGYQNPYYDPAQQDSTPWQEENTLPGLLNWSGTPAVRLAWCRVHNGEFQQPRRSVDAIEVLSIANADLTFQGRTQDSLSFTVTNPVTNPVLGYDPSAPGFRYDLAPDWAVALPLVAALPSPPAGLYPGELPAYPFFVYVAPGDRLFPWSLYSPALAVGWALRTRCRFESALKWYQLAYDPLNNDNTWTECIRVPQLPANGGNQPPGDTGNQSTGVPDQPVGETPNQLAAGVDVAIFDQPGCGRREGGACCDSTDITHDVALNRSILLHYLETLLHWGDALMRRDSPEAFQQARLIFDTMGRILGDAPRTVLAADPGLQQSVDNFIAYYPPLNPRLLDLYEATADRLGLIHHCLNARRLPNGRLICDMPYFGNDPVREGWRSEDEACADEETWCRLPGPYRFQFLVAKAQDLAGRVQELSNALLAAFEKGDATRLESLRVQQERELLSLGVAVRQDQWRDADWQVQALQKTKAVSQATLLYYNNLILNSLINNELQYQNLMPSAISLRSAANVTEGIGEGLRFIPDIVLGAAGFGGSPVDINWLPLGTKIAGALEAAARIMNNSAEITSMNASFDLTEAGWDRRLQEWTHQSQILPIEIEQIERQILGAERRRDQALRELNCQQRQLEHAAEVQDFLRDKFTAHDLYLWLQKETAALYGGMYELALETARQAQHAFNVERGDFTRHFISDETWDTLHEGLLAGERLQLDLHRLEKTYLDENRREYELTKHISLRTHFPIAFLHLMRTGRCEIDIPEWMFDLDYPGQYLRRVKNVSLTIPCVVGPYTGVHCRLTLLSSSTRIAPRLIPPAAHCCPDDGDRAGYVAGVDDPRIVCQYTALEAIATSSGQNDTGMFELNFRDERYLPFEFQGAVSRWRIEMPPENNYFDLDTLSDVILHLNYTAREGGEILRQAANEVAQRHVPGAGWRYFDLRQEFSDTWQHFQDASRNGRSAGLFRLRLSRAMFPYIPGHRELSVKGLALLFQMRDADGRASQVIELRRGREDDASLEDREFFIPCEASAEWPGLYHGVVDADFGMVGRDGRADYATLRFPNDAGEITQAFLLCRYQVESPSKGRP